MKHKPQADGLANSKSEATHKSIAQLEVSDSGKHQTISETLKDRATDWLHRHPYIPKRGKIRKLARFLDLDYRKNRAYLYQISSKANAEISFGVASTSPSSQHAWVAVGFVGGVLDRRGFPEVEVVALGLGWVRSRNRNGELRFRDVLGTVRWWATGRVHLQVRFPHTLARAKQLASNAFVANKLILDVGKAVRFLDGIRWYGSHDVWRSPSGQSLPYMRISAYKKSLGFEVVVGDSSHRDSVEIIVCPKLLERMIEALNRREETRKSSVMRLIICARGCC